MNIKANLLEECVNFVDNTKKQKKYFEIIFLIARIMFLFLFFVSLMNHTK